MYNVHGSGLNLLISIITRKLLSMLSFPFLLIRVESLQFLQKDVAVGDCVVLVGHDEELEDGPSARSEEQDSSVSIRPGFCIHHNLVQLVPTQRERESATITQRV